MANDLPTEKGRSAPGMDANGGQARTGAGDSVGELVSRVREPLSPQELHDPGAHFWLSVFLVECSWGA